MKMAVYHGIKDIRVEEVDEPKPGPGEIKVKVKYCGICGSDLHEYLHGLFPESTFGHESCGEIVEVGAEVDGFRIGDRVAAFGKGAYAQYVVCPQQQMIKIPVDMTWKRAGVVEPLAVAANGIERGRIEPQNTVLIAGAGPVGLMLLVGLKAIGVKTIYITETSEQRRKKAEELGATSVLNPKEMRISPRIRELTEGRGVDVALEAVGVEATLKDCLTSVRSRGTVVVQGIFTDRVPIHMLGFVSRETTMIGANTPNPHLAMQWIASKGAKPESIITKIVPLDQIVEGGFEALARETKEEIKILIEP